MASKCLFSYRCHLPRYPQKRMESGTFHQDCSFIDPSTHVLSRTLYALCYPANPQDAQVAKMYMDDIESYNKTAREWVKQYANMEALEASKIKKLTDMGFTEDQAKVKSVN